MHVLALDTTSRDSSVALVDERGVIDERGGDSSRSTAERLPGDLIALVEARGLALAEIDLFAVAAGPGSFTGLRIGIATIQGLAFTTGRQMVAVSALEAMAQQTGADQPAGTMIASWMDARRRTVFAALYRVADAPPFSLDRLLEIDGPTVDEPTATLARWSSLTEGHDVVFSGDGSSLYAATIEREVPRARIIPARPLAGAIGSMAVDRAMRGNTISPAAVHPLYVRRPDAELAREKRA